MLYAVRRKLSETYFNYVFTFLTIFANCLLNVCVLYSDASGFCTGIIE